MTLYHYHSQISYFPVGVWENYIGLLTTQSRRFFQKLNEAYVSLVKTGNKVIERGASWNIGDICVAFIDELQLYIRAKILSFQLPQAVQVRDFSAIV